MDPVEHLFKLGELADKLLLDTHVCLDNTTIERSDETYNGRTYRSHVYTSEAGWRNMFSAWNRSRGGCTSMRCKRHCGTPVLRT